MITLTGNGRLTRDVALRTTHSGKTSPPSRSRAAAATATRSPSTST